MSQYTIKLDPDRCISCRACEVHCQSQNRIRSEARPGLLITCGPLQVSGKLRIVSAFRPCFHCERPWCMAACPVGAITQRKVDGIVAIDRKLCVGCKACISACPWEVPQWDEVSGKVVKCDLCLERLEAGLKPACVTACTTHALSFERANSTSRKVRTTYAKSLLTEEA